MPSTLLLRTLLAAGLLSGTMVYACGSDEPGTSRDEDSSRDDDEDDDEGSTGNRDGGSNRDGGRQTPGDNGDGADDGEEPECTGFGEPCTCDDGATGFASCSGGVLSECMCISRTGDAGPPIEECPADLTCGRPAIGNQTICLDSTGMPPTCPESKDCSELDLPGATCLSIASFSLCTQPCVAEATGGGDDDAGTSDDDDDAGTGDEEEDDAGAGDEADDAGTDEEEDSDAGTGTEEEEEN